MSLQRDRELSRWRSMLRRCENPADPGYGRYGGRGIKVCKAWHDFETYYADIMRLLGPCPIEKTLDRIDNDGNYEPGNVRWATQSEQVRNSRTVLRHRPRRPRQPPRQDAGFTRFLTMSEACAALNFSRTTIARLISEGELDAFRLGVGPHGHYRVKERSVEEYIARCLPEPPAVTS